MRTSIVNWKPREERLKSYSRISTKMNSSAHMSIKQSNDIFELFKKQLKEKKTNRMEKKQEKKKRRVLSAK